MYRTVLFLALSAISGTVVSAVALPGPDAAAAKLAARDTVKLNQYPNYSDCENDIDDLYHAAPVSGQCYTLSSATGAYFLNTGGYLNCQSWASDDCSNSLGGFPNYSGACYNRGSANSISCS